MNNTKMTVELEKALDAVWLAMDYYREEGISGDEFEKERVELGAQFNLIESTLADLWHNEKKRAYHEYQQSRKS